MQKRGKYVPGGFALRVKRSSTGLGLFADERIPKGACVIEYVGRVLSKEEADTSRSKYLFEISKHKTIDGKPSRNKAGYINHSCEPNCETEIHRGRVYVMAIKAVEPGTELTYDYGEEYCREHCMPCKCPAKKHLYQ